MGNARIPVVAQCATAIAAGEIVYGGLGADLERAGKRLDDPDLRIAVIARSRKLTLVTGNVHHFEHVPGLRIENWLEPD